MARVFEKEEGFENFIAQLRKICEDNNLVPILMDKEDIRITNKTTGKKEKRGLYVRPTLVLGDEGFKKDKDPFKGFYNVFSIALMDKDYLSGKVLDIYDGKPDEDLRGQKNIESYIGKKS